MIQTWSPHFFLEQNFQAYSLQRTLMPPQHVAYRLAVLLPSNLSGTRTKERMINKQQMQKSGCTHLQAVNSSPGLCAETERLESI